MKILEINSVDFSSYVIQKTWQVQNANEYASWIDGNRISHRNVVRQRIVGTFSLSFSSGTDLDAFKSAVLSATTADGYTAINLYVSNEHQLMTINVFLTMNVKTVWTQDTNRTPSLFVVTVKIEQR